jgi:hypothetical protein
MRTLFAQAVLIALLATLAPAAHADAPTAADAADAIRTETTWMSVLLEGRKVGHARTDRTVHPDRIVTRQLMRFELGRGGVNLSMQTDETHEETPDGAPLAFTSVSTISGLEMRVEGRRIDGDANRFAVKSGAAGQLRQSELEWPANALLVHGADLRLREAGTAPGARARLRLFQPLLQEAIEVAHEVVGPVTLDLPGGRRELIEARQTMQMPGGTMEGRVWVDADLQMQRMTMDAMGQELELVACDEACATAPNQPAEILATALVPMPDKLDASERSQPLEIVFRSERDLGTWPGIDGQRLKPLADGRHRLLTRHPQGGDAVAPPVEADLARTDWLDYDSPAVQALAMQPDADGDAAARMRALEQRVHGHIANKSLRVGYASAGDAARLREGDCTEHALLLAALGRAAGIPSRVVHGLAYSDDYGGRPSLVPHAWVASWTGERWQAFDAALPGDDQLRLAVHAADGDPWRFYDGIDAFGRIEVESVRAVGAAATRQGSAQATPAR